MRLKALFEIYPCSPAMCFMQAFFDEKLAPILSILSSEMVVLSCAVVHKQTNEKAKREL